MMALKEYCTLGWPIVASFLIEELAKVGQCRLCEARGQKLPAVQTCRRLEDFDRWGRIIQI